MTRDEFYDRCDRLLQAGDGERHERLDIAGGGVMTLMLTPHGNVYECRITHG